MFNLRKNHGSNETFTLWVAPYRLLLLETIFGVILQGISYRLSYLDYYLSLPLSEMIPMFILPVLLIISIYLVLLAYGFIVTIKRLHDMNTSGWYSIFTIIPFVWLIFLFIPGTSGPNRFGDDPKTIK